MGTTPKQITRFQFYHARLEFLFSLRSWKEKHSTKQAEDLVQREKLSEPNYVIMSTRGSCETLPASIKLLCNSLPLPPLPPNSLDPKRGG